MQGTLLVTSYQCYSKQGKWTIAIQRTILYQSEMKPVQT